MGCGFVTSSRRYQREVYGFSRRGLIATPKHGWFHSLNNSCKRKGNGMVILNERLQFWMVQVSLVLCLGLGLAGCQTPTRYPQGDSKNFKHLPMPNGIYRVLLLPILDTAETKKPVTQVRDVPVLQEMMAALGQKPLGWKQLAWDATTTGMGNQVTDSKMKKLMATGVDYVITVRIKRQPERFLTLDVYALPALKPAWTVGLAIEDGKTTTLKEVVQRAMARLGEHMDLTKTVVYLPSLPSGIADTMPARVTQPSSNRVTRPSLNGATQPPSHGVTQPSSNRATRPSLAGTPPLTCFSLEQELNSDWDEIPGYFPDVPYTTWVSSMKKPTSARSFMQQLRENGFKPFARVVCKDEMQPGDINVSLGFFVNKAAATLASKRYQKKFNAESYVKPLGYLKTQAQCQVLANTTQEQLGGPALSAAQAKYMVFVGDYGSHEELADFIQTLSKQGAKPKVESKCGHYGNYWARVFLGPFPNKKSAQVALDRFKVANHFPARIQLNGK